MYEYNLVARLFVTQEEFNEWINSLMHDGWRVRHTQIKNLIDDISDPNSVKLAEILLERRVKSDGTYTNKHKK